VWCARAARNGISMRGQWHVEQVGKVGGGAVVWLVVARSVSLGAGRRRKR